MKKKHPYHQPETCMVNSQLYVFTSKFRKPTEEEINRPRLGRPKHSPLSPPPPKKNNRKKKS